MIEDLKQELEIYKSKRKKAVKELIDIDTVIIGLKVEIEKEEKINKYKIEQEREKERSR